jgi:hypothetical protein
MSRREEELTSVYDELDATAGRGVRRAPNWAADLAAPVPFVGAQYDAEPGAPRILTYASAEHLGTAEKDSAPWFDQPNLARGRHRLVWDEGWGRDEPNTRLGIAPYEDGPLLAAAALLWRWEFASGRASVPAPEGAVALTERVAVANFSKFALPPAGERRVNRDIRAERAVRDSLPYVRADLRVLAPTVVLIAKTVSSALIVEVAQLAARRGALLISMPQGSGQGPLHAGTHLERMGCEVPSAHPQEVPAVLQACRGEGRLGRKNLTADPWVKWFALLRARYDAAVSCVPEGA